jgi:hypothetical protein
MELDSAFWYFVAFCALWITGSILWLVRRYFHFNLQSGLARRLRYLFLRRRSWNFRGWYVGRDSMTWLEFCLIVIFTNRSHLTTNIRPCVASRPPCQAKMQVLCLQESLNSAHTDAFACFHVNIMAGSFLYPFGNFQPNYSQLCSVIAKDEQRLVHVAFQRSPLKPTTKLMTPNFVVH